MTGNGLRIRGFLGSIGLVGALALGGCSGGLSDGVEFNGKIFDAIGLGGDVFGKKEEPRTQARAPLVLPPDGSQMPSPGSTAPPTTASISTQSLQSAEWPKDPDQAKLDKAAAKKQAQEDYCKKDGNWQKKAVRDEVAAAEGPDGNCQGNIFKFLSGPILGKGDE